MESAPASVAGDELQIAYVPPTEEQYAASLDAVNKEFGLIGDLRIVPYAGEEQLAAMTELITKDLSEPYSIYTYRYFLHTWPKLSFLVLDKDKCVGCVVSKLEYHKDMYRGYVAMLAVKNEYRGRRLGTALVVAAIRAMQLDYCDEVVLEAEVTNKGALRLYENLGFVRHKRLCRYYLNGVDAYRLKLWLRSYLHPPAINAP